MGRKASKVLSRVLLSDIHLQLKHMVNCQRNFEASQDSQGHLTLFNLHFVHNFIIQRFLETDNQCFDDNGRGKVEGGGFGSRYRFSSLRLSRTFFRFCLYFFGDLPVHDVFSTSWLRSRFLVFADPPASPPLPSPSHLPSPPLTLPSPSKIPWHVLYFVLC